MDLADVVGGHQPRRVTVRLVPDNNLADAYQQAQDELSAAVQASQSLDTTAAQKARETVERLERQVADVSVEFVLQSIGRAAWVKLRDQHQPTNAQRDMYRKQGVVLDHNPDTFPVAAIAASLVEPSAGSPAETKQLVQRMWDEWNFGECERLWRACLEANLGAMSVPKRWTGSGTTPSSGQSSGSLGTPESPEASSTDGGSPAV